MGDENKVLVLVKNVKPEFSLWGKCHLLSTKANQFNYWNHHHGQAARCEITTQLLTEISFQL